MTESASGPLASLSFGQDVAEHDDKLNSYFLTTGTYWAVVNDEADVVLGAKGSGKSAIARYLARDDVPVAQLSDVLIIPAFNLRGSVLFRRLTESIQLADEATYRDLFFAYAASLAANHLVASYTEVDGHQALREALLDRGLLVAKQTVHTVWRRVIDRMRPRIETTIILDTEDAPKPNEGPLSFDDIESLFEEVYSFLERVGIRCWILFDRLDEAFPENREIEVAALRGLLRCYLDVASQGELLRVKMFLRLDIFERITERRGFVNATHLRTKRIAWDSESIHHLIALRLRAWDERAGFAVPSNSLASPAAVRKYCYRVLPNKVDGYDPLIWLLLVTVDGTREYNPRNVITLLRNAQLEEIQIAARAGLNPETLPARLGNRALYAGYRQLSMARLADTLYAESEVARQYIPRLRGKATRFDRDFLRDRLGITTDGELDEVLRALVYVGFLRIDEEAFLLPPLYRPALFASTHKAELTIGSEDSGGLEPSPLTATPVVECGVSAPTVSLSGEFVVSPAGLVDETAQPPAPEETRRTRRRRGGRRRRSGGRDEFVPTGARSEVLDESWFAAQIQSELGIDPDEAESNPSVVRSEPNEMKPRRRRRRRVREGADTGTEVGPARLAQGDGVISLPQQRRNAPVAAARRLAEQGDPGEGFRLLHPQHTRHSGAACVAADVAYMSSDSELIAEARSVLIGHEGIGAADGRAVALAVMARDDAAAIRILDQAKPGQFASLFIGVVQLASQAPEREARFWNALIHSSLRHVSQPSMRQAWPVLAASRVLPICRHYWVNGEGSDDAVFGFLGVNGVRDMVWDTLLWRSDVRVIEEWVDRYASADAPTAVFPELLPYQVLSVAAVLESVDALRDARRSAVLRQLSGHVNQSESRHVARFSEWSQFAPLALEVMDGAYGIAKPRSPAIRRPVAPSRDGVSGADVALLRSALESEGKHGPARISLALLGSRLRRIEPEFEFKASGYSTLMEWVSACCWKDPSIRMGRTEQGHPYVWINGE